MRGFVNFSRSRVVALREMLAILSTRNQRLANGSTVSEAVAREMSATFSMCAKVNQAGVAELHRTNRLRTASEADIFA